MDDTNEEVGPRCPAFCTAHIPTKILDKFVETARAADEGLGSPVCLLGISEASNLSSIKHGSHAPVTAIEQPFLGWSPEEIYEYWKQNIRGPLDQPHTDWSVFTFYILDEQTRRDGRTFLFCSDAPDVGERVDEAVLKTIRTDFWIGTSEFTRFEMLIATPSEMGAAFCMSVMPPAWLDTTGFPRGSMTGRPATAAVARRNKANAIRGITIEEHQEIMKTRDTPKLPL